MLAYFPKPNPDELFYSVLCRLQVHLGTPNSVELARFIYGDRTIPTAIDFPVQLQKMLENLPIGSGLKFEEILNNHSMLNYYLPFNSVEKCKEILTQIKDKSLNTTKLPHYLGVVSSKISSPKTLKFCRSCLQEDILQYGEPYYHRSHQLPGVKLCHVHSVSLSYTPYNYNSKLRNEWIQPLTANVEEIGVDTLDSEEEGFAYFVAKESWLLLNSRQDNYGVKYLRDRYLSEFLKNNLATFNMKTNHTDIQKLLEEKMPLSFLKEFSIDNRGTSWLTHLTSIRNVVSIHPLRLICLNYALNTDMRSIFGGVKEYQPFGEGPWPCLNPVCPNFKKEVITSIELRTNKKDDLPLGILRCEHCNYTYMRKGPDIERKQVFTKSRVINYGDLFKERLLHLVDLEGESFFNLSNTYFDGMDSKPLKMWYTRWKNENFSSNNFLDARNKIRKLWGEVLLQYPEKGRALFSKLIP